MQYKRFGKNGPMVSRLGFGCMRLPAVGEGKEGRCDDERCIPILRRAYALGMGLIFGWAARKAKSVWPGSALHIINNCLVFAARLAERGMG